MEEYPSDVPVAVEHIVIVVRPLTARAGFGAADEGERVRLFGFRDRHGDVLHKKLFCTQKNEARSIAGTQPGHSEEMLCMIAAKPLKTMARPRGFEPLLPP